MANKIKMGGLLALGLFLFACKESSSPASSGAAGTTASKKPLVVATSLDNPPFSYNRFGQTTGFEIDLINEIGKKLGRKIEIKDLNFSGLLAALQSKQVDCAISAITITPDRKKAVDFSTPYHAGQSVCIISKESPLQKVEDFVADFTIGVQAGSTYESYAKSTLEAQKPTLKIQSLTKIPELLQAFKNKQIKSIILGKIEADTLIKNNPELSYFIIPKEEESVGIAVPKGSADLTEINKALDELTKSGFIAELEEKHLKAK